MHRATEADVSFWSSPAAMTDVAAHDEWLAGLPREPAAADGLVSGLLVHTYLAPLYGVTVDATGQAETQLRAATDIVVAIRRRAGDSPMASRAPAKRAVGVCRHFTVLHVAFLRAIGVPARARAGHASYFEPGKWVDHWVTEWWDDAQGRWIRTDPQLDDIQRSTFGIEFDPADLPGGAFLTGGECWERIRHGDIDPDTCGILDMWGAWFVRNNVVRDLAALNKIELLPWDAWGLMEDRSDLGSEADNAAVDEIARTCAADDPVRLRAIYADKRLRVPPTITSYLPTGPIRVDLALPDDTAFPLLHD